MPITINTFITITLVLDLEDFYLGHFKHYNTVQSLQT